MKIFHFQSIYNESENKNEKTSFGLSEYFSISIIIFMLHILKQLIIIQDESKVLR